MTVCGVICNKDCRAFGNDCVGCNELEGKVSWIPEIDKITCPIYACVKEKEINNCGECNKIPCSIWLVETKNPTISDEKYKADLNRRFKNMRLSKQL